MRACHYCGKAGDLRTYGPRGEDVCFRCAMATPERKRETERAYEMQMHAAAKAGDGCVSIGTGAGPVPHPTPREERS